MYVIPGLTRENTDLRSPTVTFRYRLILDRPPQVNRRPGVRRDHFTHKFLLLLAIML